MTADELQNWAGIFRGVGLSITGIGLVITFGSHLIADKLSTLQRADKLKAENRLKLSETELKATKEKTDELERRANVIHSIQIHLALEFVTAPRSPTPPETDVGLQNVLALFTADKTRHRFTTDFKLGDQQVNESLRRLTFLYTPEVPTELYGRPLNYLCSIDILACRFDGILKQLGVELTTPGLLHISVLVNGVEVVALGNQQADFEILMDQQGLLPVAEAFRKIPQAYEAYLHSRRTR
jgi:hypothetical protein